MIIMYNRENNFIVLYCSFSYTFSVIPVHTVSSVLLLLPPPPPPLLLLSIYIIGWTVTLLEPRWSLWK
jgi:hypothetical protein